MLYTHYMFSLSLSAFGLFFLLAFCNPANQRALLLISRSANLNTSLLRQSNNETHMYVLARNLSNTSIAHYKRFLQYGVFIGACFHIPLVFRDQMEWFFTVLCLVCTYKCNGLQITHHYLQGTLDMKKVRIKDVQATSYEIRIFSLFPSWYRGLVQHITDSSTGEHSFHVFCVSGELTNNQLRICYLPPELLIYHLH